MTTNSRRRIVRKRVGSRVPAAHLSDERRGPRWRAGTTHCAVASFENGWVRESRRRTWRMSDVGRDGAPVQHIAPTHRSKTGWFESPGGAPGANHNTAGRV